MSQESYATTVKYCEGELISHDGQRHHDALVDFDKPLLVIGGAGESLQPTLL